MNKEKIKKQYDKLKQKIMMIEKLEQLDTMTREIELITHSNIEQIEV